MNIEYWTVMGDELGAMRERQVDDSEAFMGIFAHRYGCCHYAPKL